MARGKDLLEIIRNILEDESDFYKKVADQLSIEEYRYIKLSLIGRVCTNCTNGCCSVPSYEKYGDEGSQCIGWDNRELVGRSKVLRDNFVFKLN
jgi:hypothetical protein